MPARCSVRPLRLSCMRTIAAHYDLLCYGCRTRHQMAALLEAEADQGPGYQDFPGPFTSLPASLLEDLVTVISDTRGLLKQMLHQLLQPQLEVTTLGDTVNCRHVSQIVSFRVTPSEADHRNIFRPNFSAGNVEISNISISLTQKV